MSLRPRAMNAPASELVELAHAWAVPERTRLIVVNRNLDVVLVSLGMGDADSADLYDAQTRRLHAPFDAVVRELVAACEDVVGAVAHQRLALLPHGFRIVGATPLDGADEPLVAVTVERCGDQDHFTRAARAYGLSPREIEVLSLVLEGASAAEIGGLLNIAEGTVHGYFKQLLIKTRSRNRPAMVAKVLGWDGVHELPPAPDIA
jgi:DNA-binding CsgD family transcriptional regulator